MKPVLGRYSEGETVDSRILLGMLLLLVAAGVTCVSCDADRAKQVDTGEDAEKATAGGKAGKAPPAPVAFNPWPEEDPQRFLQKIQQTLGTHVNVCVSGKKVEDIISELADQMSECGSEVRTEDDAMASRVVDSFVARGQSWIECTARLAMACNVGLRRYRMGGENRLGLELTSQGKPITSIVPMGPVVLARLRDSEGETRDESKADRPSETTVFLQVLHDPRLARFWRSPVVRPVFKNGTKGEWVNRSTPMSVTPGDVFQYRFSGISADVMDGVECELLLDATSELTTVALPLKEGGEVKNGSLVASVVRLVKDRTATTCAYEITWDNGLRGDVAEQYEKMVDIAGAASTEKALQFLLEHDTVRFRPISRRASSTDGRSDIHIGSESSLWGPRIMGKCELAWTQQQGPAVLHHTVARLRLLRMTVFIPW